MVQEAMNSGVWMFGGGLENQKASIVGTDGTVTDGPYPEAIGGFWVVDVPSREDALNWAAKTADACRCAQEVREFMPTQPWGTDRASTYSSARVFRNDARREAARRRDVNIEFFSTVAVVAPDPSSWAFVHPCGHSGRRCCG